MCALRGPGAARLLPGIAGNWGALQQPTGCVRRIPTTDGPQAQYVQIRCQRDCRKPPKGPVEHPRARPTLCRNARCDARIEYMKKPFSMPVRVGHSCPDVRQECNAFKDVDVLDMPPGIALHNLPFPYRSWVWHLLPRPVDESLP
eukprot:9482316-Pyramimonas_sp.AAC.1